MAGTYRKATDYTAKVWIKCDVRWRDILKVPESKSDPKDDPSGQREQNECCGHLPAYCNTQCHALLYIEHYLLYQFFSV